MFSLRVNEHNVVFVAYVLVFPIYIACARCHGISYTTPRYLLEA